MIEALRQKFAPDRLFRRVLERGARELLPEAYLDGLTEQDRQQVIQFVEFARSLRERLPRVRFGVIAVGSTTRPDTERHHPAEDIDLRVLNSGPIGPYEQKATVDYIRSSIRDYLKATGVEFDELGHTVEMRMVWGYSYGKDDDGKDDGKKELLPFVDWYNTNPSFKIKPKEGLPLHISVSGTDAWDLDTHLAKERKHGGSFSVLMKDN